VTGDFNAKVGDDWGSAGGALGKFGVSGLNDSSECLIQFASDKHLFQQVKRSKLCIWESLLKYD